MSTSFYRQATAVHKKRWRREKKQSHIQHKSPGSASVQKAPDVSCDKNVDVPGPELKGMDIYGYLHPTL